MMARQALTRPRCKLRRWSQDVNHLMYLVQRWRSAPIMPEHALTRRSRLERPQPIGDGVIGR
jgi:hypothetical protein